MAAYGVLRNRQVKPRRDSAQARPTLYAGGLALTTAITAVATAPLSLVLFGRVATYVGLSANMLAVALVALWVMPWGMAVLALMPSGLEGWVLLPMIWGIAAILEIAAGMAAGAGLLTVAAVPPWFPFAYGVALIWLCVWRRHWRLLALALIAALLAVLARPPDPLPAGAGGKVARAAGDDMPFASFRRDGWHRGPGTADVRP